MNANFCTSPYFPLESHCSIVSFSSVRSSGVENSGPHRFGELCSCSCLPLLPQLAWKIHATWGPLFSSALFHRMFFCALDGAVHGDGIKGNPISRCRIVLFSEPETKLVILRTTGTSLSRANHFAEPDLITLAKHAVSVSPTLEVNSIWMTPF